MSALGVPPRKSLGVGPTASSPHSSYLLACGLSAHVPHANNDMPKISFSTSLEVDSDNIMLGKHDVDGLHVSQQLS